MKAAIVNFTGGRENWGCQATSEEMLRFCSDVIASFGPAEIALVPCLPRHVLDTVIERIHGKRIRHIYAAETPSAADLRFLERLVERRFGKMVDRVRSSDIVFFQGEGTMGPKPHFRGLRFFALPFLARHLWNKPVISLNQSFYAARPGDLEVAANIYRHFDVVALREAQSYALYRALGIGEPLLCPDLAFAARSRPQDGETRPVAEPYFCVTGSAAMDEYDLDSYVTLITTLARRSGLRPLLLYSKRDDARLLSAMHQAMPVAGFAAINSRRIASYRGVLPILRDARFVIGGRYHTAVTALAQRTPVILLPANTYKNEGLALLLGLRLPVFSILDHAAILAEAEDILDSGAARAGEIRQALCGVDARLAAFGDYLRRLITARLAPGAAAGGIPEMLTPDLALAAVTAGNAAIYAHVNAGRSHSLIGRWRGTHKQLGAWPLIKSQLKAKSLRRLKPYLSLTLNRRIYDLVPRIELTGKSGHAAGGGEATVDIPT